MDNSDQEKSREANLYEKYSTYSDEQLLEILKNKKDYQEIAVSVAVKIALERNLIHSEQDLFAPEFQSGKLSGRTIFPDVNNDFHRKRLTGSIFRFLFMVSAIPLVYGILNYAKGEISKSMLGISIGLIWISLCYLLKKTRNSLLFIPLYVLLFGVSIMTGMEIFKKDTLHFVDFFMLIVGMLLPVYLMLYLKKLLQKY